MAACSREPAQPPAEQALAAVIRAANAQDRTALATLLTVTSTLGGHAPIPKEDAGRLMLPKPPFAYLAAGPDGSLHLVDGENAVRRLRLIEVGGRWKALAFRAALSRYHAMESGGGAALSAPGTDVEVLYFLPRVPK